MMIYAEASKQLHVKTPRQTQDMRFDVGKYWSLILSGKNPLHVLNVFLFLSEKKCRTRLDYIHPEVIWPWRVALHNQNAVKKQVNYCD